MRIRLDCYQQSDLPWRTLLGIAKKKTMTGMWENTGLLVMDVRMEVRPPPVAPVDLMPVTVKVVICRRL